MSLEQQDFLEYMQNMFKKHGSDYEKIQLELKEKTRMAILGHFYYFICSPNSEDAREELQIVGVTSLIEAMMSDSEYKSPFQYFESRYKGENSIVDFAGFKEEYLSEYGANKKIIRFFQEYVPKDKAEEIVKNISVWKGKNKSFMPLENLEQLARFLYQMRSDFVHKADMQGFNDPKYLFSVMGVGGKTYSIKVSIKSILDIFEESFVIFWKQKESVSAH